MNTGRSDGGGVGGGEAEVVDEFACPGMLRGSLTSLHTTVERIFCVIFDIDEADFSHTNTGQIWLKLRGQSKSVKAAKLFVKGLVNQEEQQEVSYPGVLHCVFCGARGLFMDSLIRSTSANIVIKEGEERQAESSAPLLREVSDEQVGSLGFLLISGLAEPVVRAYSLITDLVERCNGTQSRRADTGERCPGESLESRRAFKALVEKWEDRHILDLLVLPGSVKEILLDLVKESGFCTAPRLAMAAGNVGARSQGVSEDKWDIMTPQWIEGTIATSELDCFQSFSTSSGSQGRVEGAVEGPIHSPQEVEGDKQLEQVATSGTEPRGEEALQFLLLLKFFTAMGYTEDVVKRVLAQTGPKEASQILDFVQQEQDRTDRELTTQAGQDEQNQDSIALSNAESNGPCESEHREDEDFVAGGENVESKNGEIREFHEEEGATGSTRHFEGGVGAEGQEVEQEEDFVLGVLKKAAASCGYTEQKVAKVYNMLPDRSTHQLLLELQREESRKIDNFREGPREMDDVVLEKEEPTLGPAEDKARGENELLIPATSHPLPLVKGWVAVPKLTKPAADPHLFTWINKPLQFTTNQHTTQTKVQQSPKSQSPHQIILPEVKGPPMPTYSSSLDPPQSNKQYDPASYQPTASTSKQNKSVNQTQDFLNALPQSSSPLKQELRTPQWHLLKRKDRSPNRAKERLGFTASTSVVVTGEQRFLEGLQKPFDLQLTDKPEDPNLRTIIIDGSNVAMSHGLGHFFSCRGIALAVQHFWDRGHRQITAFLPRWRQKNNSKAKEQHYLAELEDLGLVSYTPSREIQGKKICSYDDRFLLQLAQNTDGVIVTNDNLRDLSDESPVWRDIIKKRLLQYTFAGDLFMLPDDPLGRGGPHLDDFLRSDHRNPRPGHHSFAGVATTFPPFKPLRSQTEVLNFRDRTLGGAADTSHRGSQFRERECGNEWARHGQFGALAAVDRSPEATATLREQLCQVFTSQDNTVALVLQCHPTETDINVLSDLILQQQMD